MAEYLAVDCFQGEGTMFEVSMKRRFYFLWEDGEFDRVALLHCKFRCTSTPESRRSVRSASTR